MRLRHTITTTAAALTLVVTLPTSASAATGHFDYTHKGNFGGEMTVSLIDPPNEWCITLPEVAHEQVPPAHTPKNNTDAAATVFADAGCKGPTSTSAHTPARARSA